MSTAVQNIPRFSQLSREAQVKVARVFQRSLIAAFGAGNYDAVNGPTSRQRAPSFVEFGGEDEILDSSKRLRMTNLLRQQMRNAPITRTIDQQRRVNVVGTVGGKLTITQDDDNAKAAQDWFNNDWAPQAEFTDSLHFNEFLKLALSTTDNGGDLVALFDDGTLGDTGRIRVFEPDEIANMQPGAFTERYGKSGYSQSQGVVRDAVGRTVGVIVSTACRGLSEFDAGKCFVLLRDLAADKRDAHFVFVKRSWRFNQGRGVSPTTATANTLTDIYEIVGSETQSTKLNSKMVAQLIDSGDANKEPPIPTEYRPTAADPEGETAPEGEDAAITAEELAAENQPMLTLEQMDAIGACYDIMPPQLKMELLDTKRPNTKIIEFIDWLSGQATGVFGLGRIYATLNPEASYTAFRGAQCLSWPSMAEAQKDFERCVCDWAARNALRWGMRKGFVKKMSSGWERSLTWSWPEMPEVNIVDEQTALRKRLQNFGVTFKERLGPEWQSKIEQSFKEIEFFRSKGITHPADVTESGSVIAPPAGAENNKGTDKEV